MNETECPYRAEEFAALTEEQRGALKRVGDYRGFDLVSEDCRPGDETIEAAYNLFRPCEGCVPGDEIGDSLCQAIRQKFACIYGPAIEMAEALLRLEGYWADSPTLGMRLLVDASYEHHTYVAMVDWYPDKRPYCYCLEGHKAWHFYFETLADLASQVLRTRDRLVESVRKVLSRCEQCDAQAN